MSLWSSPASCIPAVNLQTPNEAGRCLLVPNLACQRRQNPTREPQRANTSRTVPSCPLFPAEWGGELHGCQTPSRPLGKLFSLCGLLHSVIKKDVAGSPPSSYHLCLQTDSEDPPVWLKPETPQPGGEPGDLHPFSSSFLLFMGSQWGSLYLFFIFWQNKIYQRFLNNRWKLDRKNTIYSLSGLTVYCPSAAAAHYCLLTSFSISRSLKMNDNCRKQYFLAAANTKHATFDVWKHEDTNEYSMKKLFKVPCSHFSVKNHKKIKHDASILL